MAAAAHSASRKTAGARKTAAGKGAAGRGPDAVALLKADHRAVEKLFGQFEKARDKDRRKALADKICLELKVHMQAEEEIFYPTSRDYLKDEGIVDEAVVEHAAAKDLVAEIEAMQPEQS
jgi:hemerythrin superfamily protein